MFARANGSLFVLVRHELAHLSWLGAVRVGGGAQNHDFLEVNILGLWRLGSVSECRLLKTCLGHLQNQDFLEVRVLG